MAINRFVQPQPAQDNYFNTFVPLPMEQLTALGMSRKQDLEKNQALIDKGYNDLLNIQAIPGSKDETYLKTQAIPAMTDLAMKYANVDLSQPQEVANLRREMRTKIDPNVINRIEQSHAGYLRYNQMVDRLSQEGKYSRQLDTANPQNWDSANQGVFSSSPEAYEGKASLFEPYFAKLHPTKHADYNSGMLVSSITPEHVNSVAQANARDLVNTPKGQQELRLFKANYPDAAKQMGDDTKIMQQLMNDYGSDRIYTDLTPLPYEWMRTMRGASGGASPKTPYEQSAPYMPLPGSNASTGTYKGDKDRSTTIASQVAEMDKTISSTSDPVLKSRFAAMKGGLLDEKKRIDDVITGATELHTPEIQGRRDAVLKEYYDTMKGSGYSKKAADDMLKGIAQEGDTGWAARLGIEHGSQFMSNPLGRIGDALLNTGKTMSNLLIGMTSTAPAVGIQGATSIKLGIEDLRSKMKDAPGFQEFAPKTAMDTYLKLHDLQAELEDKVATDYKAASVKSKQDMGILLAGSEITDKGSNETDTRTGKLKIPNTSLMLRNLKVSAGKYAGIEDITAVDKDKELLKDASKIHSFISNADNVGLESVGSAPRADGSYPVVITASKSLGSGKGTATKRFKLNLGEGTYENQSWRTAIAKDFEDKGMYKEADRIQDPSIEKQVLAGKHNDGFSVQLDRDNTFNFKNNGDGTYTEMDENNQPALINGQPAKFTDEEIIQNLYWLKNKYKYNTPNKFNTIGE